MKDSEKPASVVSTITGECAEVWLYQAVLIATCENVELAFELRDRINGEAETWHELIHGDDFESFVSRLDHFLTHYPANSIVCSGHPRADVGARFTAALRSARSILDGERKLFLLDIEHDPAALQALETYAFAVLAKGDRVLCDELVATCADVRRRKKSA